MTVDYIALGKRLRSEREKQKMTQENLSDESGITPTHISHIETASTKVGLPTLMALVNGLQVPICAVLIDSHVNQTSIIESELLRCIKDCTQDEMHIILETVKALTDGFRKFRPKV